LAAWRLSTRVAGGQISLALFFRDFLQHDCGINSFRRAHLGERFAASTTEVETVSFENACGRGWVVAKSANVELVVMTRVDRPARRWRYDGRHMG
jgi:hypothetical protein